MRLSVKTYLDNVELGTGATTLAAALIVAGEEAQRLERVIVEIHADGSPPPEPHLTNPPDTDPYAKELRFLTAEPRALVRTTLFDAADLLAETGEKQQQAAEMIQTGDMQDALALLGEIISEWEMIRQAVDNGCAMIGEPADTSLQRAAGPDGGDLTDGLSAHLNEVKRSLNVQDWSALADSLAFDLDEQAQLWRSALTNLAQSIHLPNHSE